MSPDKKSAKKRYEEDDKVRTKKEEFRNMILHNETDILGDPKYTLFCPLGKYLSDSKKE